MLAVVTPMHPAQNYNILAFFPHQKALTHQRCRFGSVLCFLGFAFVRAIDKQRLIANGLDLLIVTD
jgi:hypothetical protein